MRSGLREEALESVDSPLDLKADRLFTGLVVGRPLIVSR
jgi:hypothetical protein